MSVYSPRTLNIPGNPWSNTGVRLSGGIPARATEIDLTAAPYNCVDGDDCGAAIQQALNDYNGMNVALKLPEGTFKCEIGLGAGYQHRDITLRGSGYGTVLDFYTGGKFDIGGGATWGTATNEGIFSAVTGAKGANTLTVADGSVWKTSAGTMALIIYPADPTVPQTSGNALVDVFQIVNVVSKAGNVITIDPPLMYDLASGGTIGQTAYTSQCENFGLENLRVHGSGTQFAMIQMTELFMNCWIKGVMVTNTYNYAIAIFSGVYSELKACWIGASAGEGSNHAGILCNALTAGRLHNNTVEKNFPSWEINQCTIGCVFGYNYTHANTMNINHGAQNRLNLYEGNKTPSMHADCYHGGVDRETIFRNHLSGEDVALYGLTLILKRWSMYFEFVGNTVRTPGIPMSTTGFSIGNPNIGSSAWTGEASFRCAPCVLSTRTNSTSGILTAPSGHGRITGEVVDLPWMSVDGGYATAHIRIGVTIGIVSGTSVPFSGGAGDPLPAASSTIYLPTSNTAIIDYPRDWDPVEMRPRQWAGVLTQRGIPGDIYGDDYSGIITMDEETDMDSFNDHIQVAEDADAAPVFAGFGHGFITITNVDGREVSFTNGSHSSVTEGASAYCTPCALGFQEFSIDVFYTLRRLANYYYGLGIPEEEELPDGMTLPDSLYLDEAPDYFVEREMAWPPDFSQSGPQLPAEVHFYETTPPSPAEFETEVSITGTPSQGIEIEITGGSATGNPSPEYTFAWLLDGTGDPIATTQRLLLLPEHVGHFLRGMKIADNGTGSDISFADTSEIQPFAGDIFTPDKTANTDDVADVWCLKDEVTGSISYLVQRHSGPWPADPPNQDGKSYVRDWGNDSKDCYTWTDDGVTTDEEFIDACL